MKTVEITSDEIVCYLNIILDKNYNANFLPEYEDVIVNNYNGHSLIFFDEDGNNTCHPHFISWVDRLRTALNIPYEKIIFKTQIKPPAPYRWQNIRDTYKICDIDHDQLDKNFENAKFVGCLAASRWSMARTRTIYELDQCFPGDCFLTCNVEQYVSRLESSLIRESFKNEMNWLRSRRFENDISDPNGYNLNMLVASHSYLTIWNKFLIEVVCETDEYMNNRFTDKVAKVLLSGKPFVLLCGQGSLDNLKELGFVTYSEFIDESYDQCSLPSQRIRKMIQSLTDLYCRPNRQRIINEMYLKAQENIEVYKKITPYASKVNYGEIKTEFPRIYRQ